MGRFGNGLPVSVNSWCHSPENAMRQNIIDRLAERYLTALDAADWHEMGRLWKLAERAPGWERALLNLVRELDTIDGN